jgi:hypothetical protein
MQRLTLFFIFFGASCFVLHAQRILIVNGFLHPVVGQEISNALIEIEKGKIIGIKNALANAYNAKDWDTVIDASGQHIYPGFVAANSILGLTEIEAVRASNDYYDVGTFNPHIRTQIAFNAESKVLETAKTNGVLIVQSTPKGGVISGASSIMFSGGWNWEDATILADDGIHVHLPQTTSGGGWWAEPAPKNSNDSYRTEWVAINNFFSLASAYAHSEKPSFDQRLEAMKSCFVGKKRVYFYADDIQQIIDVIDFAQTFKLPFPVIIGGNDAYLVGQRLIDSHIPIMVQRLHRLPEREEDPVDLPYKLPALLAKMGVPFCLQNDGGMEAMNARNLPFLAGTAMAHGLSEAEALRSITLSPCEIMGIDAMYGTLEIGKSATLFISKGPALEMKTNNVTTILLHGVLQNSHNFQEALYLKYQEKYENAKP